MPVAVQSLIFIVAISPALPEGPVVPLAATRFTRVLCATSWASTPGASCCGGPANQIEIPAIAYIRWWGKMAIVGAGCFAVGQTMDERNWHPASGYRLFRRRCRQVDSACQPPVNKRQFHCRAQDRPAQPASRMEHLADADVGNLAEGGK